MVCRWIKETDLVNLSRSRIYRETVLGHEYTVGKSCGGHFLHILSTVTTVPLRKTSLFTCEHHPKGKDFPFSPCV